MTADSPDGFPEDFPEDDIDEDDVMYVTDTQAGALPAWYSE